VYLYILSAPLGSIYWIEEPAPLHSPGKDWLLVWARAKAYYKLLTGRTSPFLINKLQGSSITKDAQTRNREILPAVLPLHL
jgi:hypothetical protein